MLGTALAVVHLACLMTRFPGGGADSALIAAAVIALVWGHSRTNPQSPQPPQAGRDAEKESPRVGVGIFLVLTAGVAFVFFLEGFAFQAVNVCLGLSYIAIELFRGGDVRLAIRINALLHLGGVLAMPMFQIETILRRSLLTATLRCLLTAEDLLEVALHMAAALGLVFAKRTDLGLYFVSLPLRMFVCAFVPMDLLGMRTRTWRLLRSVKDGRVVVMPSSKVALAILLCPSIIMSWCYVQFQIPGSMQQKAAKGAFATSVTSVVLTLMGLVALRFETKINRFIHPLLVFDEEEGLSPSAKMKQRKRQERQQQQEAREKEWSAVLMGSATTTTATPTPPATTTPTPTPSAIDSEDDLGSPSILTLLTIGTILIVSTRHPILGVVMLIAYKFILDWLERMHRDKFTNKFQLLLVQRRMLFALHLLCTVGLFAKEGEDLSPQIFSLASLRVGFALVHFPISETIFETCWMAASQIMYQQCCVGVLSLIDACLLANTFALSLAKQYAARVANDLKESQSFLDHAIKQKFSGVGVALEHVLESKELFEGNRHARKLLQESKDLCVRMGGMCYLSTVAQKSMFGSSFRLHLVVDDLQSRLVSYNTSWNITYEFQEQVAILTDWDLLCNLLLDLHYGATGIHVSTDHTGVRFCAHIAPATHLDLKSFFRIRARVAQILGGEFPAPNTLFFPWSAISPKETSAATTSGAGNGFFGGVWKRASTETTANNNNNNNRSASVKLVSAITNVFGPLPAAKRGTEDFTLNRLLHRLSPTSSPLEHRRTLQSPVPRTPTPSLPYSSSSNTTAMYPSTQSATTTEGGGDDTAASSSNPLLIPLLPPNLLIAALDDNLLVRKSLLRFFTSMLRANEQSFVWGALESEAHAFAQAIVHRSVSIAILDENLEYGDSTILGTSIATAARSLGFRGCLILHSANAHLARSYVSSIFDGFIEKSASKTTFAMGIERAWRVRIARDAAASRASYDEY